MSDYIKPAKLRWCCNPGCDNESTGTVIIGRTPHRLCNVCSWIIRANWPRPRGASRKVKWTTDGKDLT